MLNPSNTEGGPGIHSSYMGKTIIGSTMALPWKAITLSSTSISPASPYPPPVRPRVQQGMHPSTTKRFRSMSKNLRSKARMSQQQRPLYLRQEGESHDGYSDRFLVWHRQSYSIHMGPCRYARATTPFRAEDVLTHIANCARPLTEDLTVWLEDLSERYPYVWVEVLAQVRRKGGPSLNPAPIPRVEVVLKLGLGWSHWPLGQGC